VPPRQWETPQLLAHVVSLLLLGGLTLVFLSLGTKAPVIQVLLLRGLRGQQVQGCHLGQSHTRVKSARTAGSAPCLLHHDLMGHCLHALAGCLTLHLLWTGDLMTLVLLVQPSH
jgi:hypothetical protein